MYRSLYFKIILIFVIFMITVMAVVGTVLLNSVNRYYTSEFVRQIERHLKPDMQLRDELLHSIGEDYSPETLKGILSAYSSSLGIDDYRNYYILDTEGTFQDGSNRELGKNLELSGNLLTAMSGKDGGEQHLGNEYTDYAVYLKEGDRECIIYIKDTQEEMRQLSWQLFSIILQSVFFGLVIAVVLSFFLAKAITGPIQSLTKSAKLLASGKFANEKEIEVHSDDEIGTLTVTFNDMRTALKNTLDEVTGERQKLETIFSYLKDGVIAFSDKGTVIHINRTAIQLFKDSYGEDFTLDKMLGLLYIEYAKTYIAELKNKSSYVVRDIELGSKALDINFGLLKYIDGNRVHKGYIAVIHDITIRYELDKARREFVANVSHELRTPLTSIKGANETILINPDMDDETRRSFLEMAVEESDRMLHLISDLLTLSRLDNKRTNWHVTRFDIKQSLSHLCDVMSVEAEAHGHKIVFDKETQLPEITGDRDRIEQVILNILSNSIKYTKENGLISVVADRYENDIHIVILDNGIGIPEEEISRLFERFYRVEKSRTSETGGTGLGLAIAKEIVTAHGGSISLKSKLGVGTEVTIVLPVETKLENSDGA